MRPDRVEEECRCWLALNRVPGIGPRIGARLLQRFGNARGVLGASAADLAGLRLPDEVRQGLAGPDWAGAERDLAWAGPADRHLLLLGDPDYPLLLSQIADPPLVLFVHGEVAVLQHPQIGIVGSRNPTAGGAAIAREFASHLAAAGLVITSGLAAGIDAAAHRGALENGFTLAVAGTGPDRVYPRDHGELAGRIAAQGAVVSELPVGTPPLAANFPRRNRIISGLSCGVLVIEAALRSGSLTSARHAMDQGREVFAIPGSIHNPLAKGCHALIRQGAKLVETVADVLDELGPLALRARAAIAPGEAPEQAVADLDPDYRCVLDALGYDPLGVDELVQRTGLTANVVSSILLVLELQGHVDSQQGGRYARRRN